MCHDNKVRSLSVGNLEIAIYPDEDAESPRDWDNLGVMACWHSRYNLGDEQPKANPEEWARELALSLDPGLYDRLAYWEDGDGWGRRDADSKIAKTIQKVLDREVPVILPLFLYDHSGITMRTTGFNDRWDSGQVGWIYATRQALLEEYSTKRLTKNVLESARRVLKSEVETYAQYLEGDVYGYVIRCPGCEEEFDSCWGFYGLDYCEEEAKSAAKSYTDHDCGYTAEEEDE